MKAHWFIAGFLAGEYVPLAATVIAYAIARKKGGDVLWPRDARKSVSRLARRTASSGSVRSASSKTQ